MSAPIPPAVQTLLARTALLPIGFASYARTALLAPRCSSDALLLAADAARAASEAGGMPRDLARAWANLADLFGEAAPHFADVPLALRHGPNAPAVARRYPT